ncbi:MAG: PEP-CTERM sorting domain-containing protein [Deltaproteobacteria bacterium]|nr:PEP-CTERM sorting domain-containing protein [Deltaproteobacteria bacterium]MBN2687847.1 PEP-CTERM sorting domain-containing protein [Deltaproteobacteria bacterium]
MKCIYYVSACSLALLLPSVSFADGGPITIPEPSTILLLGVAIIGVAAFLFWKTRKHK